MWLGHDANPDGDGDVVGLFCVPEEAHEGLEEIGENVIRFIYFLFYDNPLLFSVIPALE